jgi:hypothetical protein
VVHNSVQNSLLVVEALNKFGASLDHDGINAETFLAKQLVYQIGMAPVRIDILTEITAVDFSDAWENRSEAVSSMFRSILFR